MKKLIKSFAVSSLFLAMSAGFSVASAGTSDSVYVTSQLGQPLRAVVLLEQGPAVSTKLASSSAYSDRGLALPDLSKLQFDFVKEKARPFLRITSSAAFDSPAQTILLEVSKNGITEIQEHSLLLDLPGSAVAEYKPLAANTSDVSKVKVKQKPVVAVAKKMPADGSDNKDTKSVSAVVQSNAKGFDAALTTINKRLDALEKGQSQLFQQFAETDKKLVSLMERVVALPSSVVPTAKVDKAPAAQVKNDTKDPKIEDKSVKKQDVAQVIKPAKPEVKEVKVALPDMPANILAKAETDVKKAMKPDAMAKADQSTEDTAASGAGVVLPQISVNVTPGAKSEKVVDTTASPSPVVKTDAAPAPVVKPKKEFKPAPVVVQEKSIQDQIMSEPLILGGGVLALLALIGAPLFMNMKKKKAMANTPEYTV